MSNPEPQERWEPAGIDMIVRRRYMTPEHTRSLHTIWFGGNTALRDQVLAILQSTDATLARPEPASTLLEQMRKNLESLRASKRPSERNWLIDVSISLLARLDAAQGETKAGEPAHPLYLRADLEPMTYPAVAPKGQGA